jgi:hypothetical protein
VVCVGVLVLFVVVVIVAMLLLVDSCLLATCAALSIKACGSVEAVLVVTLLVVDRRAVEWAAVHDLPLLAADVAELRAALAAILD